MLRIRPFHAWRPASDRAAAVACVPYDVVSADEARTMAEFNPISFLHVIRPEIAFPFGTDEHDDLVYLQGRTLLDRFCSDGTLVRESEAAHFIYRITMGTHTQTGLFSLVSVDDYDSGRIIRHELTRPDKENDRTRHILTQEAHAEPVLLIAPRVAGFADALKSQEAGEPLYDITTDDGIRHTLWKSSSALPSRMLSQADFLYVADGHHRCKAASRAAAQIASDDAEHGSRFFPAVIFPQEQLRILPYNRVLDSIDDDAWSRFLVLFPPIGPPSPTPGERGRVCAYRSGRWTLHNLPDPSSDKADDKLDVSRLHQGVFDPLFGISDPRTDNRITFVGGIRGTDELIRLVDPYPNRAAFSLHPTSITELVAVSDAGLLMPPKSTWFEPKLRSGLLIHRF